MKTSLLLAAATLALSYDTSACNNSPALCDAAYNSILHAGAHNAAFIRTEENNFASAGNQYFNATTLLSSGIRLLQSSLRTDSGALKLCHTSCDLFDGGTLKNWLSSIKSWLSENPSEVVTILLVNNDIPASGIAEAYQSLGLDKISVTPEDGWQQQTLLEMLDDGKQLVTYVTQRKDADAEYLINEFAYVFETAFEVYEPGNFTCDVDRPKTGNTEESMSLMNHFLYQVVSEVLDIYAPNETYAETLNSEKLRKRTEECAETWGRKGGYVLVDFANEGEVVKVVDEVNGVTEAKNREEWPQNPKKAAEEKKENEKGGWAAVERLAAQAKEGKKVQVGQWVLAGGEWKGSFSGRN